MRTRTKSRIWVGVGAFVAIGTNAAGGEPPATEALVGTLRAPTETAIPRIHSGRSVIAQHADHHPDQKKEAGEGNEAKGLTNLPPELAFAVRIALLRGHLFVGDELVKQQQWNAALPHFLHPGEEIYGDIKDQLADFRVPPFDAALKALAGAVKAKKGGNEYTKALKAVNDALVVADAGMQAKQQANWAGFVVEAAVEALKTATGEYEQAVVNGRIAKPVEYQDARGFILQADRMIESVAPDLQNKDAAAFNQVRAGLAELRRAFPSAMPPKAPVKDHGAVLADVARIELAAGKLM